MMAPYRPPSPFRRAPPSPYGGETHPISDGPRKEAAAAGAVGAPASAGGVEAGGFQALAVRALPVPALPAGENNSWEAGTEGERGGGGGEGEGDGVELRRDFSAGPRNFLETLALQDLLAKQASHKEASFRTKAGSAFPAARTPTPGAGAGAGARPASPASVRTPAAIVGPGAGRYTRPASPGAPQHSGAPRTSSLQRPATADATPRVPGRPSSPAAAARGVPGRSPLHAPSAGTGGSRKVLDSPMLPGFIPPLTRAPPGSRLTGISPRTAQGAGGGREAQGSGRGGERARERGGAVGPAAAPKWGSAKPRTPTVMGYSDKPLAHAASVGGYSDKPLAHAASVGGYSDAGAQSRTDSSESASEAEEFPWRGDDPDTPSELSLDLSLKSASAESEGAHSEGAKSSGALSARSEGSLSVRSEGAQATESEGGAPCERRLRSSSLGEASQGGKEGVRRHSTGAPSAAPAVAGGNGGGAAAPGLAIRRLLGALSRPPGPAGAPPGAPPARPATSPAGTMPSVPRPAFTPEPPAKAQRQSLRGEEEEEKKGEEQRAEESTPSPAPPSTPSFASSSPVNPLPSTSVSRSPSMASTSSSESDKGGKSARAPTEVHTGQGGQALGMPHGMPGATPCGATASGAPGANTQGERSSQSGDSRLSPRLSEDYSRAPQVPSAPSSPLVSLPSSGSSGAPAASTQGERRAPRLSEEYRTASHLPSAPTSPLVHLPTSSTSVSGSEIYQGASTRYAPGTPGYNPGWRGGSQGGSHSPLFSHMGSVPGTPGRALGTPGGVPGTPGSASGGMASSALVAYGGHGAGALAHPWFTPAGSVPGTPARPSPPVPQAGPARPQTLKAEPRERQKPPIPFSWQQQQQQQGSQLALVPGAGAGAEAGAGAVPESPSPGRFLNGQGLLVGPQPTRGSGGNSRDEEAANAVVVRSKGPGPVVGAGAGAPLPAPAPAAQAPVYHPLGGGGWSGGVLNDLPPRRPPPQFSWSKVEVQAPQRPGLYGQGGSLVVGPDQELKRFLRVRAMQMAQPALPMLPAPGSEEARD